MNEADFLNQLHLLLNTNVIGLDADQKFALVKSLCDELAQMNRESASLNCHIVPFITGRRPIDEAAYPGLGSSDHTGMILPAADSHDTVNTIYILYYLTGLEQAAPEAYDDLAVNVTLAFASTDGAPQTVPHLTVIPGWDKRPVTPAVLVTAGDGQPAVQPISLSQAADQRLVFTLNPEHDLLPGAAWAWADLDEQIRQAATDDDDPFTFGSLFRQIVHVQIQITRHGFPVSTAQTLVDVCDTRRFGSLYQRIIDRLIQPDTARQAVAVEATALDYAYHPWFPVLHIGSDKAALYTHALIEDIVHKKRHLTDPRWLMRVGLYLEFLTCIGIFEAVKDDMDDLLSPAERASYEHSPAFAEIRRRINVAGWRQVWALRDISFPRFGAPDTGPVSAFNLLNKKKATLAFLQVHHDDLKQAIDLAGTNMYNAQETWHRVFRDAERAVLRKTPSAFPELDFFNANMKAFILWHQKGKLDVAGVRVGLTQVSSFFGDQDGLFASAGNQYRTSMNEVAEWAKQQHLMDYTGAECVPGAVSLLQAMFDHRAVGDRSAVADGRNTQLERLQQRDGYSGGVDLTAPLLAAYQPHAYQSDIEELFTLLSDVPLFNLLTAEERWYLARTVRHIDLGPLERIIIQGRAGSSLFLVANGRLEVLVRQPDGVDHLVDTKKRGDVIGEMSLLTGEPRSATVRAATEGSIIYEIGRKQMEAVILARPGLVDELADLMSTHAARIRQGAAAYNAAQSQNDTRQRIRRFFFGS
jgi:CRP-like cAMP-binding protein